MFLGKYKMMIGSDCKLIYDSKDYHRKRLKVLENEKYIRRVNHTYIKLDDKGTKMVKDFGYEYSFSCRKKAYIDRLNEIAKIAGLTIRTDIDFIPSWSLKNSNVFTETSRKYLGKLVYKNKDIIVYYISKDKQLSYISQVINDIQKLIDYNYIMIFIEDTKVLNDINKFIFGKESTIMLKPSTDNLRLIKIFENIDFYQIINKIYPKTEILLSNWRKADYMTENREYIFLMPFIDTEKLQKLNMFYRNNPETDRKIDIITLKENKEKINEILDNKANVIEIDDYLGGKRCK